MDSLYSSKQYVTNFFQFHLFNSSHLHLCFSIPNATHSELNNLSPHLLQKPPKHLHASGVKAFQSNLHTLKRVNILNYKFEYASALFKIL